MFSKNDLLGVRAEERMGDAINAGCVLWVLIMDVFAIKSNNKAFKKVAWILTIIEAIDKIRLIFANLNARKSALGLIDDEDDLNNAKEMSSVKGVMDSVRSNYKYQFTGKID